MEAIQGYTVLTNTINGWVLAWKVEDGNNYMPDIYNSKKDARKEIADVLMTQLQEYIDDTRDWDDIDLDIENTYEVAQISVYEDEIRVVQEDGTEWTESLKAWRALL